MTEIFASVDLTGMNAFVVAAGLAIVGVSMVFAGIRLSKRSVKQV